MPFLAIKPFLKLPLAALLLALFSAPAAARSPKAQPQVACPAEPRRARDLPAPRLLRLALITFDATDAEGRPISIAKHSDYLRREQRGPTMPTSLNQTLQELVRELEEQNDDWRRVRLALEQVDANARVAVDPRLLDEFDDLCRKRTPVVPQHGGLRV
jgi:hypothetical protein